LSRPIPKAGVPCLRVDFDRVIRDPARPTRMLPAYDLGDHLPAPPLMAIAKSCS
jgi:hypothetical protein